MDRPIKSQLNFLSDSATWGRLLWNQSTGCNLPGKQPVSPLEAEGLGEGQNRHF